MNDVIGPHAELAHVRANSKIHEMTGRAFAAEGFPLRIEQRIELLSLSFFRVICIVCVYLRLPPHSIAPGAKVCLSFGPELLIVTNIDCLH